VKIAITGGTGFAGSHLARSLVAGGHKVVLLARGADRRDETIFALQGARVVLGSVADRATLDEAFAGCDAVAHLAGINRELGSQTYQRVHVQGTRNVVEAMLAAGVSRIAMLSFLRARPGCGSPYHESKWAAEEVIRASALDYTILKSGMVYGRGDHMLDHLSRGLQTFPVFPLVGMREQPIRPVAVEDAIRILQAALVDGRLSRKTVAVLGSEEMRLSDAVRRVGQVVGRRPIYLRLPVWMHYGLAQLFERTMKIPLVARAQVRILAEGVVEPGPLAEPLPDDLLPSTRFTAEQIRRGIPEAGGFGLRDFRWVG
jgi:nucleoside-diphosphate-sugar epimerase